MMPCSTSRRASSPEAACRLFPPESVVPRNGPIKQPSDLLQRLALAPALPSVGLARRRWRTHKTKDSASSNRRSN
jgi:hypothetical protein